MARTKRRRLIILTLEIAGIVVASLAILFFLVVLYFVRTLPTIQQISNQQITQSTKIYDRTGTVLLYEINNGEKRTVAPFDQIPQSLKDATVAIEDQNFYNEPAFDLKGILRAIFVDISKGRLAQGGSTITQELARNAFLTLNQTFTRKLKELILAIRLGEYYSKDQILGLYMNEVSYGPTISGVEEASEAYFGEPVTDINLAQSAVLAALPQAPTYYSPWGSNVADLLAREQTVLQAMYAQGKITKAQLTDALNYQIVFQPQSTDRIKAPHFVMAVENYLTQKYGDDLVDYGGLKVITTLNWPLQQAAETAVTQGVARDQSLYGSDNGALVAQDPATGQILALVGSVNYFDTANDGNFDIATQGLRQPGSSLKPFVYLTAFQMGYTPDTVLFDVPTEFSTNADCPAVPDFSATNKDCFHPQDFEGTFAGPLSIRDALAQSVNVPAVKMLYLVGEQNAINNAYSFGLTTLTDPASYGLSLVLGGGAVHLDDLTEAYSVLADNGVKHAQTMVLQVQDSSGNILESYQDQTSTVADTQSVRLVNDILSDNAARAPLMGASQGLTVFPGYDVALKTGTSNDYRDAWAMGYTPSLVVGVWAGNTNNAPMHSRGSSILAAVPMWSAFMQKALPQVPNTTFTKPDPTNPAKPILAGDYLYGGQIHSLLYYVNTSDPAGPPPANPASNPQFENWETGVLGWAKNNLPDFLSYNQSTPQSAAGWYPYGGNASTSAGTGSSPISVQIKNPTAGEFVSGQVNISGNITDTEQITKFSVRWNGVDVRDFPGSYGMNYGFSWSFTPSSINSQNSLEVDAYDAAGNVGKSSVIVYGK